MLPYKDAILPLLLAAGRMLLARPSPLSQRSGSADQNCEEFVANGLRSTFPDIGIFSEESGWITPQQGSMAWCLDPLDGSRNYAHNLPCWGLSLALLDQLEPVFGAIYLPETQDLFYAGSGSGAWLNGYRLRIDALQTLERGLVSCPLEYRTNDSLPRQQQLAYALLSLAGELRMFNASAVELAYLAANRLAAYVIDYSPHVWDIAAGILLVKEAGGIVTDFHGNPLTLILNPGVLYQIIAAPPRLHAQILQLVPS